MTTAEPPPALQARSIAQLSVLKALRAFDRFTIGKVAARAGVPAATLRSLLLRWQRQGFPLLTEVGADRGAAVGQPPKLYVLAPEMQPVVDGAIAAADAEWAAAADQRWVATPAQDVPIDRLNFFDAARELVAEADETEEPARRAELLVEADRLLGDCRMHLKERAEMGLPGASDALQVALHLLEQRVASLLAPHGRLHQAIVDRAEELRRRAVAYGQARRVDLSPEDLDKHKQAAADSLAWLTTSAKHYLQTEPSGGDAEVAFFGGFLLVRGELGTAQNSLLDEWLTGIERQERTKAMVEVEARAAGGGEIDAERMIKIEVSWAELRQKFAIALNRMVDCGFDARGWKPIFAGILDGIRNNALLAVEPTLQALVSRLIACTPFEDLQRAGREYLERYSIEPRLVTDATPGSAKDAGSGVGTNYFVAQSMMIEQMAQAEASPAKGRPDPMKDVDLKNVDVAALIRKAYSRSPAVVADAA